MPILIDLLSNKFKRTVKDSFALLTRIIALVLWTYLKFFLLVNLIFQLN